MRNSSCWNNQKRAKHLSESVISIESRKEHVVSKVSQDYFEISPIWDFLILWENFEIQNFEKITVEFL